MNEQERYERAKNRVKEIKDFYMHVVVYVLVIGFLAVINLVTSPGFPWVIFPAGGWGIGLAIHAVTTFAGGPFGADWEDRKIRELMDKQPGGRKSKEDLFD